MGLFESIERAAELVGPQLSIDQQNVLVLHIPPNHGCMCVCAFVCVCCVCVELLATVDTYIHMYVYTYLHCSVQ